MANSLDSFTPFPEKALCRDCTSIVDIGRKCSVCHSRRLLSHPEVESLSIAHVDCDAFFAAVEKRDAPHLADKPVIVGGGRRGVVSTCCYIARSYGIRSAMPMFKALKLCPHAVVVKSRFDKYGEAAHLIREEMRKLTPLVQPLSIDEAFLDLSGTMRLHGAAPASVLAKFALTIEKKVGITVSIGLSHNKLLAKIASDLDKPRGFAIIGKAETLSFLAPHPPSFLFGVGARFDEKLKRDGYQTLGDLQQAELRTLVDQYGEHGFRLYYLSRGEDHRPVKTERETKSVSGETTFKTDIRQRADLEDKLYAMAQKVAKRSKEKELAGRVVTLKLKTAQFKSFTRRRTLEHYTNLSSVIFETAQHLLKEEFQGDLSPVAYRLIGVGISDLMPATIMGADFLFPERHHRLTEKENALSKLKAKYGDDAIGTMRDIRNRH